MLDPKKSAEIEQSMAMLSEHLPPLWASLFRNCVAQKFSPQQALALVQTYILATNNPTIFGPAPPSNEPTDE